MATIEERNSIVSGCVTTTRDKDGDDEHRQPQKDPPKVLRDRGDGSQSAPLGVVAEAADTDMRLGDEEKNFSTASPPVIRKHHSSTAVARSGSNSVSSASSHHCSLTHSTSANSSHGQDNDSNVVGWDGPGDPANPKNFPRRKKWILTAICGMYAILSPLSSSMVAPCVPIMSADLGVTPPFKQNMMVSIYMAGYVVGPLVMGPLSEVFGRKRVLMVANAIFIIFNTLCSRASSFSEMAAFRIFAGVGGAGPLSVCGGGLADMWDPSERGKAIALFSLGPLLGPAIGPIAGGFLSQARVVAGQQAWRWVFYLTSMVAILPAVIGGYYLRETFAPVLLKRKVQRLQRETGNMALRSIHHKDETVLQLITKGLVRPLIMATTQPIVIVLAVYSAILFGTYYILLVTFTRTFVLAYNQNEGVASLNYIALALGFLTGRMVGTRIMDMWYRKLEARNGGVGQPEMRLILMAAPCILVPTGLIIYGWTIQYHVFWFVPDIGAFLFGVGLMNVTFVVQTYTLDAYSMYGASALAATTSLRSVAAFTFPLFATNMYDAIGHGWGNTLLALIAFFVGGPGALALYVYGPYLRKLSPYAAGDKY